MSLRSRVAISIRAFDQISRDSFERICTFSEYRQFCEGFIDEPLSISNGVRNAAHSWPGSFAAGGILARSLTQRSGVPGHVEYVVDDLKGESGLTAEGGKCFRLVRSRAG